MNSCIYMSTHFATSAFEKEQKIFDATFARSATDLLRHVNKIPTEAEMKYRECTLREKIVDQQILREQHNFQRYLNSIPASSSIEPCQEASLSHHSPDETAGSQTHHLPEG